MWKQVFRTVAGSVAMWAAFTGLAQASNISWSVGVHSGPPVVVAPPPVYVAPPHVYAPPPPRYGYGAPPPRVVYAPPPRVMWGAPPPPRHRGWDRHRHHRPHGHPPGHHRHQHRR